MKAVGHIHAASLASPRLRRVLDLLRDGKPRTTRQIVRQARVMAVNACVSELRQRAQSSPAPARQTRPPGPRGSPTPC